MALLPAGFSLPPLPYLLALALALAAVGTGFARRRPPVTETAVLALAPWMVAGACVHVLHAMEALPPELAPLAGTPSVYLSVAALAGATWLAADAAGRPVPPVLAGVGVVAAAVPLAGAVAAAGSLSPGWPAAALAAAVALAAVTWPAVRRAAPVAPAGRLGPLAVFAHALDASSTAVGVDVLGFGERTPLSRLVIEAGATLTPGFGSWLFVLVKLGVAALLVWVLADYVREDAAEGRLLLGLVVALGLGPGVHNLLLFTVA
jgi:uncharacterized membrane protein